MSEDETPDQHYEEYSTWLMQQSDLHICNGRMLLKHFEAGTRFEEFLKQRDAKPLSST